MSAMLANLREQTVQRRGGARPLQTVSAGQTCEVAVTLEQITQQDQSSLILRGQALFDGPYTRAGQTDTFVVRSAQVSACMENLAKGVGSEPGSVLLLGGAYRDRDSGDMSVGWINTLISEQKRQVGMNGHDARQINEVYARMPYLEFPNRLQNAGEPAWIRWGIATDSSPLRVKTATGWETVTLERAQLVHKLAKAWEQRHQDNVRLNLWMPVLKPDLALAVNDHRQLIQATADLVEDNRYRKIVARVSDGVETAIRYLPYLPKDHTDPKAWARALFSQVQGYQENGELAVDTTTGEMLMVDRYSLMKDVANDVLFEHAKQGGITLELLPEDNLLLASKKAPGMKRDIEQILNSTSGTELYQYHFAFGDNREAVSRVVVALQEKGEHTYVVGGPHRLDCGPEYHLETLPSQHINPQAHNDHVGVASVPEPTVPADEAPADFPTADELSADVDSAIDQALAAETSPATAAAENPAGAAAQATANTTIDFSDIPTTPHGRLFTQKQWQQLIKNWDNEDAPPVVRLFTPDANSSFLLNSVDPENPDLAFGLCDHGMGFPELGDVSFEEMTSARGPLGLAIERDTSFKTNQPMSAYAEAARKAREIVLIEPNAKTAPAPKSGSSSFSAPQL